VLSHANPPRCRVGNGRNAARVKIADVAARSGHVAVPKVPATEQQLRSCRTSVHMAQALAMGRLHHVPVSFQAKGALVHNNQLSGAGALGEQRRQVALARSELHKGDVHKGAVGDAAFCA